MPAHMHWRSERMLGQSWGCADGHSLAQKRLEGNP